MRQILNKLMPFLILGVGIVAFTFGLMLLVYLFLFGALVGAVLFLVNKVRHYFKQPMTHKTNAPQQKPGRIIDTDDYTELK